MTATMTVTCSHCESDLTEGPGCNQCDPMEKTAFELWAEANPEDYALYMAVMDQEDAEPVTELEQDWRIDSMESAEWVLRLMGEAHSRLIGAQAEYAAEQDRIRKAHEARIKRASTDLRRLEWRFTAELREFARMQIDEQNRGKKKQVKSLVTSQATLCFVDHKAKLAIEDDAAALAYVTSQGQDDCIRIKAELAKEAYKRLAAQALQDGNEMLPGVVTVPASQQFDIKF